MVCRVLALAVDQADDIPGLLCLPGGHQMTNDATGLGVHIQIDFLCFKPVEQITLGDRRSVCDVPLFNDTFGHRHAAFDEINLGWHC